MTAALGTVAEVDGSGRYTGRRAGPVLHGEEKGGNPALNRIVLAATLVAALTFAVMIGAFYIAEQYLQRVAGFSALGAVTETMVIFRLEF